MFDPVTTALIRSAPPLDGLDINALPKRLTEAFADIVSARIQLRSAALASDRKDLSEALAELRRIASAHEVYVALLPERDNRAAAAFVAASAHQACLLGQPVDSDGTRVDTAFISPEICSTLLFLIAEAHADAAEAAKRIIPNPNETNTVERALLEAVRNLAQGKLGAVISAEIPEIAGSEIDISSRALQGLQVLLLRGVQRLATQLRLRRDRPQSEGGAEPSSSMFLRVKGLCSHQINNILDSGDEVFSLYPGPLHLASLLLAVEKDLLETALGPVSA